MKRIIAVVGVLAVAVSGWLWWRSDERRIGRALERLERACEKEGPEGALSLLGRTQTILDAFAPGFRVSARPYEGTLTDARELAGVIHRYRALSDRIRVRDAERRIEVQPNGTAEMSALFAVDGSGDGRKGRESFRAQLYWVEVDGDWKIREVEVVEVVERSGLFL